jgi:hypothetical protein
MDVSGGTYSLLGTVIFCDAKSMTGVVCRTTGCSDNFILRFDQFLAVLHFVPNSSLVYLSRPTRGWTASLIPFGL